MLIIGNSHPFILVVNNLWILFILRNNEPANIVLSRINRMTNNFFFTPFGGRGLINHFTFRDRL